MRKLPGEPVCGTYLAAALSSEFHLEPRMPGYDSSVLQVVGAEVVKKSNKQPSLLAHYAAYKKQVNGARLTGGNNLSQGPFGVQSSNSSKFCEFDVRPEA